MCVQLACLQCRFETANDTSIGIGSSPSFLYRAALFFVRLLPPRKAGAPDRGVKLVFESLKLQLYTSMKIGLTELCEVFVREVARESSHN